MKLHPVHLVFLVGLGVGIGFAGCNDDWRSPRCTAYETFRSECVPECPVLEDCALLDILESKSASELDLREFDACMGCLEAEAAAGTCQNCELETTGESCSAKLAQWLDLDCL